MQLNLRRPPYRTYSISQLCREFGATPRALRFYEEQGLLFPARRDTARVYSYKDRARLRLIMNGRRVGLSIAEIRDILDLYDEEGEIAQNAEALKIFRRRIAALEAQRQEVDLAIDSLKAASDRLSRQFPTAVALEAEA
ncbi:MerR family DNA-binding transcriptional regulator [Phenylobacterium sp.]|uniref:MerR family transcriptional regulator n=2 Tax=Phenylobacterium sp. TaxID=1871053 RepID=UPI002CC81582|nr:MerR family DNA-binding transcriptional regulator [Phenylobacterium sp.]HVI34574.1 MerR family DNA-binding transcriptional regulator [Phenylobacterium sp.]